MNSSGTKKKLESLTKFSYRKIGTDCKMTELNITKILTALVSLSQPTNWLVCFEVVLI